VFLSSTPETVFCRRPDNGQKVGTLRSHSRMRAFVLVAVLALASASASTDGACYDECPEAPAKPGDRRRGDSRTFTLAVQHVPTSSIVEAPDENQLELRRTRLDRVASEITALDADFVHLTGVEGCAMLNGLLTASAAIDARVVGDYRPYLVAREGGASGGTTPTAATLTRVDPTTSVYLAPGENDGEPSFAHYFARVRIGRVDVIVTGVDGVSSAAIRADGSSPWSAEVRARVESGDEMIVLGDLGPAARSIEDALENISSGVTRFDVWVSPGIAAARRKGKGRTSKLVSSAVFALEFVPGAFTNEEETIVESLRVDRIVRAAYEVVFALVFFPGVYALAFPARREASAARKATTTAAGRRPKTPQPRVKSH